MDPVSAAARQLVSAVAEATVDDLDDLVEAVRVAIVEALPELVDADARDLLAASVSGNVAAAIDVLRTDSDIESLDVPTAAIEYARRLAQWDVPATSLIRAYRLGQDQFIEYCISRLITQSDGYEVEGQAALQLVHAASGYVDRVVEHVLTAYTVAHDDWVRDRSAVQAMRVREVLRGDNVDVHEVGRVLNYRLNDQCRHVALIAWADDEGAPNRLEPLRATVEAIAGAVDGESLLVPSDESCVWAWLSTSRPIGADAGLANLIASSPEIAVAIGDPGVGVEGFRRSHVQAEAARSVALAAGPDRRPVTPFSAVAPIAAMCTDLDGGRAWVHETLGDLAIANDRNAGLRDTALVFLEHSGSYTATADELFLHRNTAQYRISKAEEERGRPLREDRLAVELSLLACRWLGNAVLRPPS